MQKITIAGHLGSDPEVRHTPSGQKVTTFRVAVNSKVKGEEVTTWYRVSVWGDRFDGMMNYLKKGSTVIVVGDFKTSTYIDREGKTQVSLEITADSLLFPPSSRQQKSESSGEPHAERATYAAQASSSNVTEDDLPF